MAALDVLQLVRDTTTPASTTKAVSFSAVVAGDLLVFVVCNQFGSTTVTPPAGLTSYTTRATEWPRLSTYARVVESGDSTSWTFTFSASEAPNVIHAYRIEGPFTDLSFVTITDDASFSGTASRKVLVADVSVPDNTLVVAAIGQYQVNGAVTVAWSNSFANDASDTNGPNCRLSTARRLYATSSSTVASTASWTGNDGGNTALIRIQAPSTPSGPAAAALARASASPLVSFTRSRFAGV